MSTVLVTGGKGTLGSRLVPLLRAAGHHVTIGTRRPGAPGEVATELAAGDGLDAAVAGREVVVHLASDARRPQRVDVGGTARLLAAAAAAGVGHVVYVSIVGVDRHPLRYYRAKLAAEGAIEASGLPHTILRATQFHDLVGRFVDAQRRLPLVAAPRGVRFQVVEMAAVARLVASTVAAGPAGRLPDVGGPEAIRLIDLVRDHLRAVGRRRLVVPFPLLGAAGRAFRAGVNLTPNVLAGSSTWEQHVAGLAASGVPA